MLHSVSDGGHVVKNVMFKSLNGSSYLT